MDYKGYSVRVVFDGEAGVLFGEVEGLRDVVTFEATNVTDLETAFHDSVDDYLEMCDQRGEAPEKPYSGKFLVRADPRLHRDIAQAAARAGMSLNAYAADALKSWIEQQRVGEPVASYSLGTGANTGAGIVAPALPDHAITAIGSSTEANANAPDTADGLAGSRTPASVGTPAPQTAVDSRKPTRKVGRRAATNDPHKLQLAAA